MSECIAHLLIGFNAHGDIRLNSPCQASRCYSSSLARRHRTRDRRCRGTNCCMGRVEIPEEKERTEGKEAGRKGRRGGRMGGWEAHWASTKY